MPRAQTQNERVPNRRPVNLADYEGDEDVIDDDDLQDADFEGDHVLCIIRKILCTPKVQDTSQRHQNFHA